MTARTSRDRQYATKAKVRCYIEAARELGVRVGGFEVTPDGTIRILAEQAVKANLGSGASAYDDWKREGN